VPATLPTHEVLNQPPPLVGYNAFEADVALQEALEREGGGWGVDRCRELGEVVASPEADEHCRRAQRNTPVLHTHDRYGNRIDRVEYDPGFHWMLRQGIERGLAGMPWRDPRPGAHVVRAALFMLANGLDTGPCCPMSINYAAVPTLRQDPALAAQWEERVTRPDYDSYAQAGMVMTEKQGGSDLRANTTVAEPVGDGWYELTGHKWFCTHPVFEFFFTLAQTSAGPTCFVAERGPGFELQRLKDKLGGRCLASSEVEFRALPARILGEEGHGIRAMMAQIGPTRLDTLLGIVGITRRAVAEAVHHCRHRSAFGGLLAEQPAMENVLADLAIESEAATAGAMRVARAWDDDSELPFRRFATAVMKYWTCKRGAPLAAEALECLGGNGYIEEAPLARLYRDIQIGTVWEGSGNVMVLDVVRAASREPEALEAFLVECELARGADARLDHHLARTRADALLLTGPHPRRNGRRVVEDLAVALEASLLVRHAPPDVADAFCAARLGDGGRAFGTIPGDVPTKAIVERSLRI
jgi:putative acyl-CoA dehydrogenase